MTLEPEPIRELADCDGDVPHQQRHRNAAPDDRGYHTAGLSSHGPAAQASEERPKRAENEHHQSVAKEEADEDQGKGPQYAAVISDPLEDPAQNLAHAWLRRGRSRRLVQQEPTQRPSGDGSARRASACPEKMLQAGWKIEIPGGTSGRTAPSGRSNALRAITAPRDLACALITDKALRA